MGALLWLANYALRGEHVNWERHLMPQYAMIGEIKGKIQIEAESSDSHQYSLRFSVKRERDTFKTQPVWPVHGRMTKKQLLELRDAIDAELDRAFLAEDHGG